MAHRRIRSGTTKGGKLLPNIDFGTSQAVVAGDQIFLTGQTGLALDGSCFIGEGNPAAQAEQAMSNVKVLLEEAGAHMEDICMITTYVTEQAYQTVVYPVIARYLHGICPVSTGLIVKSLAESYIEFEIDIWAIIPNNLQRGHKKIGLSNVRDGYLMPELEFVHSKAVLANDHVFLHGQTGLTLDGKGFVGEGDPAKQAENAMQNVKVLLEGVGAHLADICKVTTYLTNPSFRDLVYPVLANNLKGVTPVSTGTVVKSLGPPELNFEIDVFAMIPLDRRKGHDRFRPSLPNYLPGVNYTLSKVVRSGKFIFLQGQTGLALDGSGLVGRGNPAMQAEEAMNNVKVLLEEAGARMEDVCKITTYVKDQTYRPDVYSVIADHLKGVNPTSTGIVPQGLASDELDFEIDVFAVIPENRR